MVLPLEAGIDSVIDILPPPANEVVTVGSGLNSVALVMETGTAGLLSINGSISCLLQPSIIIAPMINAVIYMLIFM
jgi:hypothetical protein